MKRRFASLLSAGLLAATATAVLAATPAQAFHRHHYRHVPPGPTYAYDYRPAPYPPVAYPPVVVAPPPVIAGPPPYPAVVAAPAPVYAAPVAAPPVMAGPVMAGPVMAGPPPAPPAEAAYATGPVPPGTEGTPDCLVVREYTSEIEVGGAPVEGYGYACLKADGSWQHGAPVPAR